MGGLRVQCARVSTALHYAATCLVIAAVVWVCQWVYRQSRPAGLMFAAGLAIRFGGGLLFVAASYLGLPLMARLQLGNGFWMLAPDARQYYWAASRVVPEPWTFGPIYTITPGYVGALAWWMRLVGVSPAGPVLFSVALYAVSVVAIVLAFGGGRTPESRRAIAIGVAALSFSPMLIFTAIFGLKDVFVTTLIVLLAIAYLTLLTTAWSRATLGTNLFAAVCALALMWLIAETRAYLAILIWTATAVVCLYGVMAARGARLRQVLHGVVALTALAAVIVVGSESNYPQYIEAVILAKLPPSLVGSGSLSVRRLRRHPPVTFAGLDELDRRRDAIIAYGGDSVFNSHEQNRLRALGVGVAAVFVPSSILERLSIVNIHIRTAARLVADADTVALDLTIGVVLWLLIARRRQIAPAPLIFALALTLAVALPLAYVMTNYGTLVRLRLMVAAPIWLTMLALAPGSRTRSRPGTPAPSPAR